MQSFGISRQQASKDINTYINDHAPKNLEYDKHLKGYVPSKQFIKGAALAEFWLIPFVYRLVMLPAALSLLCHPYELTSALDSWPEPRPSAGQDSMGMALVRSK
jgi:hypothetical protein